MGYATSPTFPSGKLSRSQILVNPSAEQETTLCGTAWEQSCQSYGSITKVKWKKFVLIKRSTNERSQSYLNTEHRPFVSL